MARKATKPIPFDQDGMSEFRFFLLFLPPGGGYGRQREHVPREPHGGVGAGPDRGGRAPRVAQRRAEVHLRAHVAVAVRPAVADAAHAGLGHVDLDGVTQAGNFGLMLN